MTDEQSLPEEIVDFVFEQEARINVAASTNSNDTPAGGETLVEGNRDTSLIGEPWMLDDYISAADERAVREALDAWDANEQTKHLIIANTPQASTSRSETSAPIPPHAGCAPWRPWLDNATVAAATNAGKKLCFIIQ